MVVDKSGKAKFWLLNRAMNKSGGKKKRSKESKWALTPNSKEAPGSLRGSVVINSDEKKEKKKEPNDTVEMKQKYRNVPKTRTAVEEEGAEVFEDVRDAQPVFATTLIRPGKMRWKNEDGKDDEGSGSGRSSSKTKEEPKEDKVEEDIERSTFVNPGDLKEDATQVQPSSGASPGVVGSGEIAKDDKKSDSGGAPLKKKGSGEKEDDSSDKLLKRIEKLEKENMDLRRKLNDVQMFLRQKRRTNRANGRAEDKSIDLNDDLMRTSDQTLLIMKKNQILDKALDEKGNRILFNFFREFEKPNEVVAKLIEDAINRGIQYMINYGDQIDDVIDNDIRSFICDPMAKRYILASLFDHPELVPDMWGGGPILVKLRKDKDDVCVKTNAALLLKMMKKRKRK